MKTMIFRYSERIRIERIAEGAASVSKHRHVEHRTGRFDSAVLHAGKRQQEQRQLINVFYFKPLNNILQST